jgi:integrase
MAGSVKHAKLESRTARSRLKRGRQPHWQALVPGKMHLGYQCREGDREGRWLLRRYLDGKYSIETLGRADDVAQADGERVLSFEQAEAKARAMLGTAGKRPIANISVRQAVALYVAAKRAAGHPVDDIDKRSAVHILPALGNKLVAELTADQLRSWLASMAATPAQTRPRDGKPQYRHAPATEEQIRRRRATANRVLTILKAALNHAYDEGHVSAREAWGRKVKPFRDVEVARQRYLKVAEATRLLNACDADFRPLVRAALETGCRYGELARLMVEDFNPDSETVHIRKSKSGKARHIVLTPEGAEFLRHHCAGRPGTELMFRHANGGAWKKSEQARPMREACARARILPAVGFHVLRHTWASLATMAGVPLMIVARNLGHADTRMCEKHYAHLAPSYIAEAIRAGAPRYGVKADKRVEPIR